MIRFIALLLIFSLLLNFGNTKPSKRKHRDSNGESFEEEIEETISEERNETLFAVLTKFNEFYEDILPEIKLTINNECCGDNRSNKGNEVTTTATTTTTPTPTTTAATTTTVSTASIAPTATIAVTAPTSFTAAATTTTPRHELTAVLSVECLNLNGKVCAAKLKKQFNQKVKDEYVRIIEAFIRKTLRSYTAILKDLPENDPHIAGIQTFQDLITGDLPKLNAGLELETLDFIFNEMHDGLKPKYLGINFDEVSTKLYEELVRKYTAELPTMQELNEMRATYINKLRNELVEDLRAVELLEQV